MTTATVTAIVNEAFVRRLAKHQVNLQRLEREIERTPDLIDSVIAAAGSDNACMRFAAVKLLRITSEAKPQLVYPHFEFLAKMLHDQNSILKWNAMLTLANLARIDSEKRLDGILDEYLKPVSGSAMIDAANTMRGAALIAQAKPYLAGRIAHGILAVEQAVYATPECRNVAIGHAIKALDQFFASIEDHEAVSRFIHRQQGNSRSTTSKKAQRFCRKWLAP